jgi:hypothetical protein
MTLLFRKLELTEDMQPIQPSQWIVGDVKTYTSDGKVFAYWVEMDARGLVQYPILKGGNV